MGEQNRAGGASDGNARGHVGRKGQAQGTATLQLAGTSWGELVLSSQIEGDSDDAGSGRLTVPNSPMWNGLALGGRPTWRISQLPQKALNVVSEMSGIFASSDAKFLSISQSHSSLWSAPWSFTEDWPHPHDKKKCPVEASEFDKYGLCFPTHGANSCALRQGSNGPSWSCRGGGCPHPTGTGSRTMQAHGRSTWARW